MLKLTLIYFLLFEVYAQNFSSMDMLDKNFMNYAFEKHLIDSQEPISGAFLSRMLDKGSFSELNKCSTNDEDIDKKTNWEILLIVNETSMASRDYLRNAEYNEGIDKPIYHSFESNRSLTNELSSEGVFNDAKDTYYKDYGNQEEFNQNTKSFDKYFRESLLRSMAKSELDDHELAKISAEIIGKAFSDQEDRYEFLSSIADYLGSNYNMPRNPNHNNSTNNPDNIELPEGDLSLKQIVDAAIKRDIYSGGVCNDVAENIAIIGKYLFPDQDVLTLTTGSHFVTIFSDGKKTRVINYGSLSSNENGLGVYTSTLETNTRVSKVDDKGQLKQIAILDTQTGELVKTAFDSKESLLRSGPQFDKVAAIVKKVVETQKKQQSYTYGFATGKLDDQQALVIAARYDVKKKNNNFYAGIGTSVHNTKILQRTLAGIHIKAGYERNQILYKNENANFEFLGGVHLSGSKVGRVAGSIDINNKLSYAGQSKSGFKSQLSLETQHSLGPKSWGYTTGNASEVTMKGVGNIIKNMRFHYNQVLLDMALQKDINKNLALGANFNSRISPVGSHVSFTPQLLITKPNGVEIVIFSGYEKKFKGTSTQHNILPDPEGGIAGVDIKMRNVVFGASVRGIGSAPFASGSVKVPLNLPNTKTSKEHKIKFKHTEIKSLK